MALYHKIQIEEGEETSFKSHISPISVVAVSFICPLYKMLLQHSVTVKDMESVDVELHNTLEYIQENAPEPLCLKFALNKTVFGEVVRTFFAHMYV